MIYLSKLTDDEVVRIVNPPHITRDYTRADVAADELRRRLAVIPTLTAELEAEYEDHQKTKQLLNEWRDAADAAVAVRDRLREAMELIAANPQIPTSVADVARMSLAAARKEKG